MRSARWYAAGQTFDDSPVILDDGAPIPIFVQPGATGLEAPAWAITTRAAAGVGGAKFDSARVTAKTITLPVYIGAASRAEMRVVKNDLIAAINPEQGAGMLVISEALGTQAGTERWVSAVYQDGLGGDESGMKVGPGRSWWEFTLRFLQLDPYWRSVDPARGSWVGRDSHPFFPRRFPWRFSGYGVEVDSDLVVTGDVATFPTWQLTAPFTRMRFTNDRTGEWWEVARGSDFRNIDLTVVTEPRVRIVSADGLSKYGWRTDGSRFFALAPGDTVSVVAEGTTEASRVDVAAPEAWLSAW